MIGNHKTKTLAVTTLGAAIIGLLALNGGAIAARFTETPERPATLSAVPDAPASATAVVPGARLGLTIPSAPQVAPETLVNLPAPRALPSHRPIELQTHDLSAFGLACGAVLSAVPVEAGMVEISVKAPCKPEQFFQIRQGDMLFSDMTSALGHFETRVPALQAHVVIDLMFEDGDILNTQVSVPEADQFDRVVLQWEGDSGLQIHALEFGADYGDKGHVSAASPRDPSVAMRAVGGFLSELGARDLQYTQRAEVYSFPSGRMGRNGLVRLSVEAEVTAQNCGKTVEAQSMQITAGVGSSPVDISLTMPECAAVGDFLVLKNLLRDLKIAQK